MLFRISLTVLFISQLTVSLAQQSRLLRFPAVHGNQVVFSYAGDLYTVLRDGGVARKLTNSPGYEMFPRFSHDGKQIAFTGQYDGNTEVFIIPATGGEPKRITYTATLTRDDIADRMGPNNLVMTWAPDDKSVIFRSRGTSFNPFKGKLYKAPLTGDLPEELPFAVAGWCSYNEDGSKIAMNRVFREFRTWKYYHGGMADDVWIFDTKTGKSENITNNRAQDIFPMYAKDKVYFLSDRDRIMNLFEYDTKTRATKKVTNFTVYDCKFPSLGNDAIVFENGGEIFLYDLASGKSEVVKITIAEDFVSGRSKQVDASKHIFTMALSPDGKRAALSARGDIFSIPAKSGVTRNLTSSAGSHDRNVEWSPDGKWISYISDRSGEDEVYIQRQDSVSGAKQITQGGGSYKFNPTWSSDSKKLLLADRNQDLYYVDINTNTKKQIAHSSFREITDYTWAPDSKWIAYTEPGKAREFDVIQLYNIDSGKKISVTDKWYDSGQPTFSPDGKYLYFVSARDFNPVYSDTEWNHAYVDMSKPYVVRLDKNTKAPFAIENDEVSVSKDATPAVKIDPKSKNQKAADQKVAETPAPAALVIDETGLPERIESLPVAAGNYFGLAATNEGLYYSNSSSKSMTTFKYFSVKDKKETEIGIFNGYTTSADVKKILFRKGSEYFIEDLNGNKIDPKNKLDLSGLKMETNLRAEWKQIFNESWRQMRDYFYDPNMHGVNWKEMREKYEVLLPYVNHRNDLTYLIGEMVAELNVGHAYVSSGDRPDVERIKMGLLGARFSRDKSGYYRIDSLLSGESWDKSLVSPLRAPGADVKKGDFIISVNGSDVKSLVNIYQSLIGKADQIIEMTVNSQPSPRVHEKSL